MTGDREPRSAATVKAAQAKGRPMLSWVGKRPLREVRTYPTALAHRLASGEYVREVLSLGDTSQP